MKLKLLISMLAATLTGAAQNIVGLNVPTDLCAGADTTASINISFGQHDTHSVVIQSQVTTLGHSERIFLPDGIPCGDPPMCTYRSPVTFNSFLPGATVTNVNDIKYVRLNIEHSFIGDLYIGIRCPNGTRATLMRFNGYGSPCSDTIPSDAIYWTSNPNGNGNVPGYTSFGIPNSGSASGSQKCDSTVSANAPGIGWNYCWSNNTNSGYRYASGDGIIYRYRNYHSSIDSSNVAAKTNFYKPDQNFNALVGCPLNGTWTIEVIDGYSVDNGYIFEWELSLDATLLPPVDCHPTEYIVDGPGATPLNDSLFHLQVPGSINGDTLVPYIFHVVSSCGDTIDTTAYITVHPSPRTADSTTACGSYTYKRRTYTSDTTVLTHTQTAARCDSIHSMRITVNPVYNNSVTETIVENQLPYTLAGHTFTRAVNDTVISAATINGCDSTTHITLLVHPNVEAVHTVAICDSEIPFTWNGRTYNASTIDSVLFTAHTGADSTDILHLTVNPTHQITLVDTVVENNLPYTFCGIPLTDNTDTTITLTNRHGCDSLVSLSLTVHLNHNYSYSDTICDNLLPYSIAGHTFSTATDTTLSLADQYGADSTVNIRLTVHPTYTPHYIDTVCDNQLPYMSGNHPIDTAGTTVLRLTSTQGCDSTVTLQLTIHPTHQTTITDEVLENNLPYHFCGMSYRASVDTAVTLANQHNCDSIVNLHLTVHFNHSYTYSDTICDNLLPYPLGGHILKNAIDTTFTLTDQYGADSTVSIQLTVNPTYNPSVIDTVCDNQLPYLVDTYAIDTAGYSILPLLSDAGCDSIVNLHLTILPTHHVDLYDTICINTSYTFGGDTYSQSGNYVYPALNQYGCDSITTLHLGILAGNLKASIKGIPLVASADNPHVDLYDHSTYAQSRTWNILGDESHERHLTYTFPIDVDSVTVYLTAHSIEGCSDTTSTVITIDRAALYLPNAFTPTLSTNSTWYPVHLQITELEIFIYNRHGLLVRHLEGLDAQWDGTDEGGNAVPQGVYVYNLTYRTLHAPNRLQRRNGTITLIR